MAVFKLSVGMPGMNERNALRLMWLLRSERHRPRRSRANNAWHKHLPLHEDSP
jgi:hypothetical protein